jgi:transcriptional regulator with GAF, ATPase, and Fis domain
LKSNFTEYEVLAIAKDTVKSISLHGLTALGGAGASGIVLEGLSHAGDYVILAQQHNGLAIHPLKGKSRQPHILGIEQAYQIEDLILVTQTKRSDPASKDSDMIQESLLQISEAKDSEKPLEQLLKGIMQVAGHEMGLIISKNLSNQFEVLLGSNLAADRSWISENLIQDCLKNKKPTMINNLIGSLYNSSQSLVTTGFLSVFCWPLLVQGESLGVLVTGSRRPHAGLALSELKRIDTLMHIAAILSGFRLRELSLKREIAQLRAGSEGGMPFQTQSAKLRQTCEIAKQVADSDLSVLIQGETGVGKEVMARWLHEKSSRARGPFVAVNCGAIPSELLESLLFGHKKGSFTHAFSDQIGKIQQAHGGTLFLDEIGDLPPALQPKLLRVLNDKRLEPIGAIKPIAVDARILTATHKPLKELVATKAFRDDLYYRLAEMTLWIPPLRSRAADIVLIAGEWLRELDAEKTFSDDARQWMLTQSWKGNVRELKSAVKRAVVLCGGKEVQKKHFLLGIESELQAESAIRPEMDWLGGENLEEAKLGFVMAKIQQALERTGGNRTKAARLLGVTSRTLFRYLEDQAADEEDMKEPSLRV